MDKIFDEIRDERVRQDVQWGGADHDDTHGYFDRCRFIEKQLRFALRFALRDNFRERMVKIAAIAVAAAQSDERICNSLRSQEKECEAEDDGPWSKKGTGLPCSDEWVLKKEQSSINALIQQIAEMEERIDALGKQQSAEEMAAWRTPTMIALAHRLEAIERTLSGSVKPVLDRLDKNSRGR